MSFSVPDLPSHQLLCMVQTILLISIISTAVQASLQVKHIKLINGTVWVLLRYFFPSLIILSNVLTSISSDLFLTWKKAALPHNFSLDSEENLLQPNNTIDFLQLHTGHAEQWLWEKKMPQFSNIFTFISLRGSKYLIHSQKLLTLELWVGSFPKSTAVHMLK